MKRLREHFHVLQTTLRRLWLTPGASLLNMTIIGIALSLPVGAYVLLKSVQQLASTVADAPQISAFLDAGKRDTELSALKEKLEGIERIAKVEFVSRDAALQQLQQSTGVSDMIGDLPHNPLPDTFIIYPKVTDTAAMEALFQELQSWKQFDHVQLDSAWIKKLDALLNLGRLATAILATSLSLALIAITFNTIRLQILTRRDEIEVTKLIGASDSFIRRPFLYFGLLQGLTGGFVAWLLVSASLWLLNGSLVNLTQLYASDFLLHPLSWPDSLALFVFSGYLGWLGAWFSVSQHLWQIEPR
ncbi:MAG: permease-like cell division protein FtsX [Gammaproteobacteria bacterium]|nr:permease-like cell division protein FtsX [Gammaproteobacteria bacterium]MBU1623743.1 permease-like cell division protein FtsX [Gammaproteobacteria bacterium]